MRMEDAELLGCTAEVFNNKTVTDTLHGLERKCYLSRVIAHTVILIWVQLPLQSL